MENECITFSEQGVLCVFICFHGPLNFMLYCRILILVIDFHKHICLQYGSECVERGVLDAGSNNSGYYELQAVLTHKGRSSSSGHYVAWVKSSKPGQFTC